MSRLRALLFRLVNPRLWSLRGRFLYVTGLLLLLGNVCMILFLSYGLEKSSERMASENLGLLQSHILDTLEQRKGALLAQAATMAQALRGRPPTGPGGMEEAVLEQAGVLRLASSLGSLDFLVLGHDNAPLFLTGQMPGKGALVLSAQAARDRKLSASYASGVSGPVIAAAAPLDLAKGEGCLVLTASLTDILKNVSVPQGYGAAVLSTESSEEAQGGRMTFALLRQYGARPRGLTEDMLEQGAVPEDVGLAQLALTPIRDISGETVGGVLTSFDASPLTEAKWNRIYQFSLFFLSGAIFLWIFLFLNVGRIERFLARLRQIMVASHSSSFSERFESDHVHCLEQLDCHNEECPVYQNPSLVCYLETGSEAISPRWRDTCVYLNKYDTCASCPVYALRSGDELTEMRNVVNTMMRLWGNFLSRVGRLLSHVLRAQDQSGQTPPSLDEVSTRLGQMAELTFFSHDLQGALDKDEVYQQLAHVFADRFGLGRYVLFEADHDAGRLLVAQDSVPDEPLCKRQVATAAQNCRAYRVAEDVLSYYNPVLCPHFNCDPEKEVRCCLPLVMSGKVGAVFSFLGARRDFERIRGLLPVQRKYLDETAPVLSSIKLLTLSKEQALRDPLTQCHNRRFLDEFMAKYEPASEREGRKTGFLMADLDHFKLVNDEYGHAAGDEVLKQAVRLIQQSVRRSDLVIRYGGEEFLVLLQNLDGPQSEAVADKIRSAVEQHRFDLPGGSRIHKTISLGVALHPDDGDTMAQAIGAADLALYQAKRAGRNRCVRFTPDMRNDDSN